MAFFRTCAAGLCLVSFLAHAEKVLVLDFENDEDGRVRAQIEAAVRKAGRVEVASMDQYAALAKSQGVPPIAPQARMAFRKLADQLGITSLMTGSVAARILVRIYDSTGQQVWTKDLPSRQGKLSADHARRLAAALAVAALGPNASKKPTVATRVIPPDPSPMPVLTPPPPAGEPATTTPSPPSYRAPTVSSSPPPGPAYPPSYGQTPPPPQSFSPATQAGPGEINPVYIRPVRKPRPTPPVRQYLFEHGPKYFRLEAGVLVAMRSYCARPGVEAGCEAYDALPSNERPSGPVADFSYRDVYPGFIVSAEAFPLATLDPPLIRGLGVVGGYGRGFSTTSMPGLTAGGLPTTVPVRSIDERWWVMPVARYYFGWDDLDPTSGYVGIRGGYMARGFGPDRPASVFLPGTHRRLWGIGVDVQLPIRSWIEIEGGFTYYFNAGVTAADAAALGTQTESFGIAAQGGLSGDFAGPMGYFIRAEWVRFDDSFGPSGTRWTNGGFAREVYLTFTAGLSASF